MLPIAVSPPSLLWACDRTGSITYVNDAWLVFRGRTIEQEIGSGWLEGVHPHDRAAFEGVLALALEKHQTFTHEFRMMRADGQPRWILCNAAPRIDEQDIFEGLLGSCVDITDRHAILQNIEARDRLLKAIAGAAQRLLESDRPLTRVPGVLRLIGDATGADRAYVYRIHESPRDGSQLMSQLCEWNRQGLGSQAGNPSLQNLPIDPDFTFLLRSLSAGELYGGLVRELPEEDREFHGARGIRSILIVPIFARDRLWGFLGFDDCTHERIWSPHERGLLTTISETLGVSISRSLTEDALRERDALLRGLARATHELLAVPDMDAALLRSVRHLAEAAAVDRVCILENLVDDTGLRRMRVRTAWDRRAGAAQPDPRTVGILSYDELFPRWYEILSAGRPISGRVLDFLSPRESPAPDLRSILLVPIMVADRFWGIVGFDDGDLMRKWAEADESILTSVAGAIGGAVQRKRVEDDRRRSDEHYRLLIENVSDVIAILSPDGALRYLSAAVNRSLGYEPAELMGRRIADFLHGDDLANLMQILDVVRLQPEAIRTAEFRLRHRDGSWRVFEGVGRALPEGQARGYVVNARDITERRAAEHALRRSEELLRHSQKMEAVGRLAGGVAHDFNNLLTAITGYGELVLGELEPGSPLEHEVQEICRAAERAHTLTRQLLAFSRRQVLEPRLTNLNSIVSDMEKLLRRLIGEDIDLQTELAGDLGAVRVDPGQIEQVVINLCLNSRDAMPDGGRISIRTRNTSVRERLARGAVSVPPGNYVALSVADTGGGLSDYVQAHLFEPFFTTKEVGKGTGLGLSMAYGIMEQSGGHIMYDTEHGKGTTFTLYFPHVSATVAESGRASAPAIRGGSETVLVAEDEEIVRDLTERVLRNQGYTVLVARNGADAIAVANAHAGPIDLLLTDLVMPRMGGRELAEKLRHARPGLRVIFMSGYAQDALQGMDPATLGRNFIQKPFTPAVISRRVRDVLDAR